MIDTVMDSLAVSKFDDTHKALIRADLERASDANVRVVEKAIGHVEVNIDGKGTSFYRSKTGYMELNMKDDARENIRTFWHEFGHYIDDGTMHKANGLKLKTSKSFDGDDIGVLGATSRADAFHAYRTNTGIPDLQRFLDQMAPGKYEVRGPNYASIYLKGTKTQVGEEWGDVREDFKTLVEEINTGLKHQLGADASEQYLRSLGKPPQPTWSDYWVFYRTPKRQTLKTKPAYKGAEDAYRDAYSKYVDELNTWKKMYPDAYIEADRLYKAYVDRATRFQAITDLLDGQAHGEMGMRILWGGHSSAYSKTGDLNIREGWANWFQLAFQNDVEMLTYLQQFAPEAKRIFQECFDEMVRQTFGG